MNTEREIGIFLQTRDRESTLRNYRFQNEQHAREWLSQGFVTDDEFAVNISSFRRKPCCGEPFSFTRHRSNIRPSEFLNDRQIVSRIQC